MCWHWQELGFVGEEYLTLITPSHQGSALAVHCQAHAVQFPIPVPLAGNVPRLWHQFRAESHSCPFSRGCSISLQLLGGMGLDLSPSLQGSPTPGPANSSGATRVLRGSRVSSACHRASKDKTHVTFELCQHLHQVLSLLLHLLGHGALPHPEVPQGAEREPPQLPPLLLIVGHKSWRDTVEISPCPPCCSQEWGPCLEPG